MHVFCGRMGRGIVLVGMDMYMLDPALMAVPVEMLLVTAQTVKHMRPQPDQHQPDQHLNPDGELRGKRGFQQQGRTADRQQYQRMAKAPDHTVTYNIAARGFITDQRRDRSHMVRFKRMPRTNNKS